MTRLLLLAYGKQAEYARAVFAALSAWAFAPAGYARLAAAVFTDQPAAFAPYLDGLPVTYYPLSGPLLAELRGPQHYTHRTKAAVVAQASTLYPGDELLFIDSDTFFVAAPGRLLQQLAAGTALMHQREYTLAEAVRIYTAFGQASYPRRVLELLAGRTFRVGHADLRFGPGQVCWNSGVLGLPPALAPVLPDVLALLDELYAASEWFVSEQVAFSLALQAAGPLEPAEATIYHYWNPAQKVLADELLAAAITPTLAALPLPARLGTVRQLVPRWHRQLQTHKSRHDALYAFGQGHVLAGFKCAARAFLAQPLHAGFVRDATRALSQVPSLRLLRRPLSSPPQG